MDNNKEKSKCNEKENQNEEIQDLKESYKLGKEYYKNIEKKIDETRK